MESVTILTDRQTDRQTGRNYGVDLLRIISMFMVCLLHVLGHGGVLKNTTKFSLNYNVAWLVESIAFCAVNCYALISGFVGAKSKYKLSNIFYLWLQVALYSLFITVIFALIQPNTYSWQTIVKSFLPVTFTQYWYFSAYFALFLLMPILNSALNNLQEKQLRFTLLFIVLVCCFLTLPRTGNLFNLNGGYSTFWLIILYLIGGYINKYNPFKKIKSKLLSIILIFLFILIWLSRLVIEFTTLKLFGEAKWGGALITYISPLVFSVAVIMLELFSRIKFNKHPKIISLFSSVSFGVYLIHEHPMVRNALISNNFISLSTLNPILMFLSVIGSAFAIYIVCSLIDYLRLLLFKFCKIKSILLKIENGIKTKLLNNN